MSFPLLDLDLDGIRGRVTPNFGLDAVTWFRVGGPAQALFQPADADDLALFLQRLPESVPVLVIGVGSNLLVRDGGIEGVVIRLSAKGFGAATRLPGDRIRVGAALPDKRVAAFALEQGLSGFAFYHGIPGGIGGALRMNAGANGGETRERLVEVTAIDRSGRRDHALQCRDGLHLSPHGGVGGSHLHRRRLSGRAGRSRALIRAAMDEVEAHRERAQPIREKTGGSTFKNPPGHSAWKLVDAAGCRGLMIGGAQVSEMHCNFLINTGSATAHDLELLGETVRARVLATSGIRLDWEIKRLGIPLPGETVEPFLGA